MAAQRYLLRIRGLYTAPNPLSRIPDGALVVAENVWLKSDGSAQARPGFSAIGGNQEEYSGALTEADVNGADPSYAYPSMASFKGHVFAHRAVGEDYYSSQGVVSDDSPVVSFDENGGRTEYVPEDALLTGQLQPLDWGLSSGNYTDGLANVARFVPGEKSLYWLTSQGVMAVDEVGSGALRQAGLRTPSSFRGAILSRTYGGGGGIAPGHSRAYRVVWGFKDDNNVLHLSPPSGRIVVHNPLWDGTLNRGPASTAATFNLTGNTSEYYGSAAGGTVVPGALSGKIELTEVTTNNPSPTVKTITTSTTTQVNWTESTSATATGETGHVLSALTRQAILVVDVPAWVDVERHFLQVYASEDMPDVADAATGDVPFTAGHSIRNEPSDEMRLVWEGDIRAWAGTGYANITDITSSGGFGDALYSSPSQEGAGQTNDAPPAAYDATPFHGHTVYGRPVFRARTQFRLLSTDSTSGGLVAGNFIAIGPYKFTAGASFAVTAPAVSGGVTVAEPTPAQAIEKTAHALVNAINAATGVTSNVAPLCLTARYASGSGDAPGLIEVEADYFYGPDRALGFYSNNTACWTPGFGARAAVTTVNSIQRVLGETRARVDANASVGLTSSDVGRWLYLYAATATDADQMVTGGGPIPAAFKITEVINPTSCYVEVGEHMPVGTYTGTSDDFVVLPDTVVEDTHIENGIIPSKLQQPESVPLENLIRVGSPLYPVLRVVTAGDACWVVKEDGLYRLTGSSPADFRVDEYDTTIKCRLPHSVAALENRLFLAADGGMLSVGDGGKEVVDLPVAISDSIDSTMQAGVWPDKYLYLLNGYVYDAMRREWTTWTPTLGCSTPHAAKLAVFLPGSSSLWMSDEASTSDLGALTGAGITVIDKGPGFALFSLHVNDYLLLSRWPSFSSIMLGDDHSTQRYAISGGFSIAGTTVTLDLYVIEEGVAALDVTPAVVTGWKLRQATAPVVRMSWAPQDLGTPDTPKRVIEGTATFREARPTHLECGTSGFTSSIRLLTPAGTDKGVRFPCRYRGTAPRPFLEWNYPWGGSTGSDMSEPLRLDGLTLQVLEGDKGRGTRN